MAGISITLAGNFSKLDELKDKAHKTAGSIRSAFDSNMGKAMFSGIAVAGTAAFAGILASIKQTIDAGGELADMMASTGAKGAGLLVLQRAFKNAGLAAGDVTGALNKMQKALTGVNEEGEPTNKAFDRLGLSVRELKEMDPVDAFLKISQAISSIENPAERTAVAMELFSKSGGKMLAVVTDASAFAAAKKQLGELAELLPHMDGDLDTVGDAFEAADEKTKQLGAGIASELMPHMLAVAEWINNGDFVKLGSDIGSAATDLIEFVGLLGQVAEKTSAIPRAVLGFLPGKAIAAAASMNPMEGKALPAPEGVSIGGGPGITSDKPAVTQPESAAGTQSPASESTRPGRKTSSLADAIREAQVEQASIARSKAAAMEEYNFESQILSARLAGDERRLEALLREKQIREEMKRLEDAGYTPAEARRPATAKVDAEKTATGREQLRDRAEEERQRIEDTLQGRVKDIRGKQEGLGFESSIGAISSMQRIGGGGGAVGSGLDYQRQSAELQRDMLSAMKELVDATKRIED